MQPLPRAILKHAFLSLDYLSPEFLFGVLIGDAPGPVPCLAVCSPKGCLQASTRGMIIDHDIVVRGRRQGLTHSPATDNPIAVYWAWMIASDSVGPGIGAGGHADAAAAGRYLPTSAGVAKGGL